MAGVFPYPVKPVFLPYDTVIFVFATGVYFTSNPRCDPFARQILPLL